MKLLKQLLILILILIAIKLNSQTLKNSLICEGIFISSVVLNGIGDGLNADANGSSWQGHLCNAASIGLLLISPMLVDDIKANWFKYGMKYTCIRFALFDPSYGLARGQGMFTNYDVSMSDKVYNLSGGLDGIVRGAVLVMSFTIKF